MVCCVNDVDAGVKCSVSDTGVKCSVSDTGVKCSVSDMGVKCSVIQWQNVLIVVECCVDTVVGCCADIVVEYCVDTVANVQQVLTEPQNVLSVLIQ